MSATRRSQSEVPSKELSDDPRYDSSMEKSSEAPGAECRVGNSKARGGEPRVELGKRGDSGKGRSGATTD